MCSRLQPMRRVLFVALLGVLGCDDDGGGDASSGTTGMASTSGGSEDTSGGEASTTAAGSSTAASTGGVGSTGDGGSTSETETTAAGSSESGESGSSTGDDAVVSFADIQVDLENVDGAQGAFPSCIDGVPCHNNPDRNVVLVANPTPEQLMQNYQNILDAPGTPWVTPLDDSAQMLNEVPIPDDVRARWLAWIQAGAPFE